MSYDTTKLSVDDTIYIIENEWEDLVLGFLLSFFLLANKMTPL